jgi:hypothetical protein
MQEAATADLARLLRLSGERRAREADCDNDREPDQSHGHLVEEAWRESSRTPGPGVTNPACGCPCKSTSPRAVTTGPAASAKDVIRDIAVLGSGDGDSSWRVSCW